jgi:hypothetical protein
MARRPARTAGRDLQKPADPGSAVISRSMVVIRDSWIEVVVTEMAW